MPAKVDGPPKKMAKKRPASSGEEIICEVASLIVRKL